MKYLLHIISRSDWENVCDTYAPRSLKIEGFIHCSTIDQVLIPANERFTGTQDLILLVIDVERVNAPIKYEDCEKTGLIFPHIYGALQREAVVNVCPFPCREDGSFELPKGIKMLSTMT